MSAGPGAHPIEVAAWLCVCARCGYEWRAYEALPAGCASCKSRGWQRQATAGGFAGMDPELAAEIQAKGVKARVRAVRRAKRVEATKP